MVHLGHLDFSLETRCIQLKLENGKDREEAEGSLPCDDLHDPEETGEEQKRDIGPQPLPMKTARQLLSWYTMSWFQNMPTSAGVPLPPLRVDTKGYAQYNLFGSMQVENTIESQCSIAGVFRWSNREKILQMPPKSSEAVLVSKHCIVYLFIFITKTNFHDLIHFNEVTLL
ncbi:protein zwilch homolog isoform X2 [Engraulis encrasicolus]|uniref:protein zwilch homolog isoform X2 n=1 Tax=Engraulis encrasicolus TaxID=184585 RepID=UPI002FD43969